MWNDSAPQGETGFARTPDGLRLRYRRMGDGPVILLLHGWPQTGHAWRRVMPTLAMSGYTVVAPDRRGSGDSDKPTGGYDALTQVEDLRALLHALELSDTPLIVVGHGDGGAEIATAFAQAYPQEVAAISLISTVPGFRHEASEWHVGFHRTPDLPETVIAPHLETYVRHFLRAWAHDPHVFSDTDSQVYVDALSAPGALRASLETYRAEPPADKGEIGAIPCLALIGESDPRLPIRIIQEHLDKALPETRLQIIPRGGHWLPEERPDAVAAALLTFLKEINVPGNR